MKYRVNIIQNDYLYVDVDTTSSEEAISKAETIYNNGEAKEYSYLDPFCKHNASYEIINVERR
ncbi:MAG: hypothetical protein KKB37_17055 [Alphaproteobacteria bacterium]|nr:hypothetical protein [Alphaproteobacteria bacterium]